MGILLCHRSTECREASFTWRVVGSAVLAVPVAVPVGPGFVVRVEVAVVAAILAATPPGVQLSNFREERITPLSVGSSSSDSCGTGGGRGSDWKRIRLVSHRMLEKAWSSASAWLPAAMVEELATGLKMKSLSDSFSIGKSWWKLRRRAITNIE